MSSATSASCSMNSGRRSRRTARPPRPDRKLARSAGLLDVLDRLFQQLVHGAADLVIGLCDALGVEVAADLLEHVVLALRVLRHDHVAGISLGVGAGEAELLGRPKSEHLVAPGDRLEPQLLVVREALLEILLALVEGGGHAGLAAAWERSAACIKRRNPQINSARARLPAGENRRARLCPRGPSARFPERSGRHLESSRPVPRRGPRSLNGAPAPHGFPQATVHPDEPPPPHL